MSRAPRSVVSEAARVRAVVLERPRQREYEVRAGLLALARIEAVRLLGHPIFLGGVVLTIAVFVAMARSAPGAGYWGLAGWGLFPLAGATLLVTNLVALRDHRHGTSDLSGSLPVGERVRTGALLLAVPAAAACSVALLALAYAGMGAGDGLPIGWFGETATPSLRELAQGPAAVLAFGSLGVALGRWVQRVVLAPLVVFGLIAGEMVLEGTTPINALVDHRLTWFWAFANPGITPDWSFWPCYQNPFNPCDVERFAAGSAGWHVLYLAAFAALFGALALLRDAPPRRLLVAAGPAAVVVVAALLQLPGPAR